MFTAKASVLRLTGENTQRGQIQRFSELSQDVGFIAQFKRTNSTLQCTLRDSRQAHHIVPGHELSLLIVRMNENNGVLLVDVDDGQVLQVDTKTVKKRPFFLAT